MTDLFRDRRFSLFTENSENGRKKFELEGKADEECLLLFFDLLYRKYKGGK